MREWGVGVRRKEWEVERAAAKKKGTEVAACPVPS